VHCRSTFRDSRPLSAVTQKTDRDVRLNSSLNAQRGEAQSAERSSLAEDLQRLAEQPEKK
jgi:hypothetical protein